MPRAESARRKNKRGGLELGVRDNEIRVKEKKAEEYEEEAEQ